MSRAHPPKTARQCRTCPWRQGTTVDQIPGYCPTKHSALRATMQTGLDGITGARYVFACHGSTEGAPTVCAGWLEHAIGPGNNLAARLAVMQGTLPRPITDGPQVDNFDETFK